MKYLCFRFIIHRCERNLYQRKHVSADINSIKVFRPHEAREDLSEILIEILSCQLHCLAQPGEDQVKKSLSSVSIQTVPVMAALNNGEIATISRAVNGGTRLHQVENMLETDTLGKTKERHCIGERKMLQAIL